MHEGVMPAELSQTLLDFIAHCIPTYEAAELLLLLAGNPDRDFNVAELVVAMRPVVVSAPELQEYVDLFAAHGVIVRRSGRIGYGPSTREIERSIGELAHAYNERPVSLVVAIYRKSVYPQPTS